jgi:integrase
MKGYIRRQGRSSWELTFDLGRDPVTGKRLRQFITVRGSKRAAQARLREALTALDQGAYVSLAKGTVSVFLDRWLQEYVEPNTRPRTREGYEGIVKGYLKPELGRLPLSALRPEHVQELYRKLLERGLSPTTVYNTHRVLSGALTYAVKAQVLGRNVCDAVTPPRKRSPEIQTLSLEQALRLREAAQHTPYGPAILLLLDTGMRRSEVLGLKWPDIDLEGGWLSVLRTLQRVPRGPLAELPPKSKHSRRRLNLTGAAVELLRQVQATQWAAREAQGLSWDPEGYVFARGDGSMPDPGTLTHAFGKLVGSAGLPRVRLHDLRHTHATIMLKMDVHPKIVQERLGHASITTTLDLYSHVVPGLQEAAVRKFEEGLRAASPEGGVQVRPSEEIPRQNSRQNSRDGG